MKPNIQTISIHLYFPSDILWFQGMSNVVRKFSPCTFETKGPRKFFLKFCHIFPKHPVYRKMADYKSYISYICTCPFEVAKMLNYYSHWLFHCDYVFVTSSVCFKGHLTSAGRAYFWKISSQIHAHSVILFYNRFDNDSRQISTIVEFLLYVSRLR